MSATCATDGCERDALLKWAGYCGPCNIAWCQLDTCGLPSDHAPENPPKCWACLDRPARIGFDKCMTCSVCWLGGCGRKPLSGDDVCREHRERDRERARKYMRDRTLAGKKPRPCGADGCDAIIPREATIQKLYCTRACGKRQRWANPEFRKRRLERNRERWATDPEYRERILEWERNRRIAGKQPRPCRAEDCDAIIPPEARANQLYHTKACGKRQRRVNPEVREREREYMRRWRAAKKLNNSNTEHLTC